MIADHVGHSLERGAKRLHLWSNKGGVCVWGGNLNRENLAKESSFDGLRLCYRVYYIHWQSMVKCECQPTTSTELCKN